jgi:hypothetical protein
VAVGLTVRVTGRPGHAEPRRVVEREPQRPRLATVERESVERAAGLAKHRVTATAAANVFVAVRLVAAAHAVVIADVIVVIAAAVHTPSLIISANSSCSVSRHCDVLRLVPVEHHLGPVVLLDVGAAAANGGRAHGAVRRRHSGVGGRGRARATRQRRCWRAKARAHRTSRQRPGRSRAARGRLG